MGLLTSPDKRLEGQLSLCTCEFYGLLRAKVSFMMIIRKIVLQVYIKWSNLCGSIYIVC
jgi:hypothetical protein